MASSKNRSQLSVSSVQLFVLATAAALTFAAEAQSQDCSTLVLSMADCLTYVTSGSTVSKPEGQCCSGLKSVLRTDAQCLCDAFKNSASFGVQLDLKRALGLPAACHVAAPSAKTCGLSLSPSGSLSPAAAPAASPVGGGGGSPSSSSSSIANAPSGGVEGGSEISPSAAPPQQGANGSQMLSSISLGYSIALVFAAASFIFSN